MINKSNELLQELSHNIRSFFIAIISTIINPILSIFDRMIEWNQEIFVDYFYKSINKDEMDFYFSFVSSQMFMSFKDVNIYTTQEIF